MRLQRMRHAAVLDFLPIPYREEAIMEAWQQYQMLSRGLNANVKLTIRQMVPAYLDSARFLHDSNSLYRAALSAVKFRFPASSPRQADVLASYLVGVAAVRDNVRGRLDSMGEIDETEALRLQMATDRLSKLMSTLSNLLKKISDTQQSIVQNLK